MKRIQGIKLLAVLLVVAGLVPAGCQTGRTYESRRSSNPIQDEFTAGKDRAPTAQTLYAMARLLSARHRDPQAEYVLQRVIEDHPDFVPAYIDLAEIQMRRESTAEALGTLDRGLAIEPDNAMLLNNAGVCLMVDEDYAGAEARFAAASEAAPHVARYRANRGVAMALMRDYDQALQVFLGALNHADAHYNLAMICQANGDTERAALEMSLSKNLKHED